MSIYKGEIRIGIREKIGFGNLMCLNNNFSQFKMSSQILIKRAICPKQKWESKKKQQNFNPHAKIVSRHQFLIPGKILDVNIFRIDSGFK